MLPLPIFYSHLSTALLDISAIAYSARRLSGDGEFPPARAISFNADRVPASVLASLRPLMIGQPTSLKDFPLSLVRPSHLFRFHIAYRAVLLPFILIPVSHFGVQIYVIYSFALEYLP